MNKEYKTLVEFISHFNSEEVCREYFEQIRFKDGDYCPHCKHNKINRFKDGKRYRCASCKRDFTIKTGTLFGESKIPMQKWFIAIYLLTTSKKGISSISLAEQVGVTQKTAWFMDHRIREALKQGGDKLFGTVEVDETYLGGKHLMKEGRHKKSAIMGMRQRGGQIRAKQIPSRETHIVLNQIKENIRLDASIMSDEFNAYKKLSKLGYNSQRVKHGKKTYVRGNVHTNSIESFWALFKRNYHGTYHLMSKKHLQKYIDEVAYRFNNREETLTDIMSDVVTRIAKNDKMTYKSLIA